MQKKNIKNIIVAKILKPHGLAGYIQVWPYTGDRTQFQSYPYFLIGKKKYTVEACKGAGKMLRMKFDGVDTIDAAYALCGMYLELERETLTDFAKAYAHKNLPLSTHNVSTTSPDNASLDNASYSEENGESVSIGSGEEPSPEDTKLLVQSESLDPDEDNVLIADLIGLEVWCHRSAAAGLPSPIVEVEPRDVEVEPADSNDETSQDKSDTIHTSSDTDNTALAYKIGRVENYYDTGGTKHGRRLVHNGFLEVVFVEEAEKYLSAEEWKRQKFMIPCQKDYWKHIDLAGRKLWIQGIEELIEFTPHGAK